MHGEPERRDPVKQPESQHHKPLVLQKNVAVTRDIQDNRPTGPLLRVEGPRVGGGLWAEVSVRGALVRGRLQLMDYVGEDKLG